MSIPFRATRQVAVPAPVAAPSQKKDEPGDVPSPERQRAERLFKNFDTNGDGFISLEEYQAGMAAKMSASRAEKVFREKDLNGDGKLTLDELLYVPANPGSSISPETDDRPKSTNAPDSSPAVPGPDRIEYPKYSKHGWLFPVSIMAIVTLIFNMWIIVREKS